MFLSLSSYHKYTHSIANGQIIPIENVSDPTFAQEMIGKGVAILPADGKFYAPCSGKLTALFPTGHAYAIASDDGAEVLVHIGSSCYNRFKDTKLPDWLAFFSGKRCVAIVTAGVSIVTSVVLYFVWPLIYAALVAFGTAIIGLGPVGAGIYAMLNRAFIPLGLHHALNAVFWFDTAGINDLVLFWSGADGAVKGVTGQYMTGFFPVMMFGLPAGARSSHRNIRNYMRYFAI